MFLDFFFLVDIRLTFTLFTFSNILRLDSCFSDCLFASLKDLIFVLNRLVYFQMGRKTKAVTRVILPMDVSIR